jgi:hypothetical protein
MISDLTTTAAVYNHNNCISSSDEHSDLSSDCEEPEQILPQVQKPSKSIIRTTGKKRFKCAFPDCNKAFSVC